MWLLLLLLLLCRQAEAVGPVGCRQGLRCRRLRLLHFCSHAEAVGPVAGSGCVCLLLLLLLCLLLEPRLSWRNGSSCRRRLRCSCRLCRLMGCRALTGRCLAVLLPLLCGGIPPVAPAIGHVAPAVAALVVPGRRLQVR